MVPNCRKCKYGCIGNKGIFYFLQYNFNIQFDAQDSAGSGFDDYGGELELHRMNFADRTTSSVLIGRAKARYQIFSI
jgi:hypothetical protein